MQTRDDVPEGLTVEEAKIVAKTLVDTGFDAIAQSGGIMEAQLVTKNALPSKIIKSDKDEFYLLPEAEELKPVMGDCPLILVGGIKNPITAENILKKGTVDFISMSRPLIREPSLPNRWKDGDLSPAKCLGCNRCLFTLGRAPIECIVEKKARKKSSKQI